MSRGSITGEGGRYPTIAPIRNTFFFVAVILVGLFVSLFFMGSAVIRAENAVAERQGTIELLNEINALVRTAESGQRGFVITGDERYLSPYNSSRTQLTSAIAQLNRRGAQDFTDEQLDAVQQAVLQKMAELDRTIELRRVSFDEAASVVKTDEGERLMAQITGNIRSLLEQERALVAEGRTRSVLLSNIRTALFGAATILSLFVIYRAHSRIAKDVLSREAQSLEYASQRELLQVTLGSIGDAVIVTDLESRITFLNHIAQQLTGWSADEAIGQPCATVFNIISEENRQVQESPVDKVLRLGVVVGLANHTLLIRKDGSEIPIDDSGAPIRDANNEIRGVVLVFRDFTDHKTAQQKLLQSKLEAEDANRAKDNFLASLSHELRTPLTPIVATLAAWENNPDVPDHLRTQVQLMKRNVDLEARLIDDLLDLTRIVQGKLSLNSEVVDLHELIQATAEMYQSETQGKRLHVDLRLKALRHHAYGDQARMQQIFWNILKNATKFTPQFGLIEVETRNSANGSIEIAFRDTGIGMSEETLAKLFKPFEQGAEEVVRQAGGLGLGMAISRALVTAQSGTITAASEGQGKGSTFTVTLPTVEAPRREHHSGTRSTASAATTTPCSILMVEDHPDTAQVMAMLLRGMGHTVQVATTVSEAMEALEGSTFDIMVSDVGLPDGTGVDLIRQVRAIYGPEMPAIALTGFGMEEDIARTREAGFNEHLTKPVNTQKLERYIQMLTAKARE